MRIAMPMSGGKGATVAEVNLRFIWDVVNRIKFGRAGKAFVVEGPCETGTGRLRAKGDAPTTSRNGDSVIFLSSNVVYPLA